MSWLCSLYDVVQSCFFFKQKTAYEMRISDWSSDVCSSDLRRRDDHRGSPERDAAAGVDGPACGAWLGPAVGETVRIHADGSQATGRASCRGRVRQYV